MKDNYVLAVKSLHLFNEMYNGGSEFPPVFQQWQKMEDQGFPYFAGV